MTERFELHTGTVNQGRILCRGKEHTGGFSYIEILVNDDPKSDRPHYPGVPITPEQIEGLHETARQHLQEHPDHDLRVMVFESHPELESEQICFDDIDSLIAHVVFSRNGGLGGRE